MTLFVSVPKGWEDLLVTELTSLGAGRLKPTVGGVQLSASLELAYRICLWSRLASRVFLEISRFTAARVEDIYPAARRINWSDHLELDRSFAVRATGFGPAVSHSGYAALRVKDAVVDRFRDKTGMRPDVSPDRPDLPLHLHIQGDDAFLGIDLSGEGLHRRGYRIEGVTAPLKENLAAAILMRCGWSGIVHEGGALIDPMCGSGTLAIEGTLMAGDIAPGLTRTYYGFLGWRLHDNALWNRLKEEAGRRRKAGGVRIPPVRVFDADPAAVEAARRNATQAGLKDRIEFECRNIANAETAGRGLSPGLFIANPPYGERLGDRKELENLYADLGRTLKRGFAGWEIGIFTGNPELKPHLGLRARRRYRMHNGRIPCELLRYRVEEKTDKNVLKKEPAKPAPKSPERRMVENRLRKNLKHIGRWARKNDISCFRIYDRDLPEFNVAIDHYEGRLHLQEYERPADVDAKTAAARLRVAVEAAAELLDMPKEQVVVKVRRRQRGTAQYERMDEGKGFFEVGEGGLRFLVNLTNYLDTGLFLDQRLTRQWVRDHAAGKRFLNLFCYTGTATVYAADGGARSTLSVDLSATYLDWAGKNLHRNRLGGRAHQREQADCLKWMSETRARYDLIFLDPPSFSNSKKMGRTFDVQRDHVQLIEQATRLLNPDGTLLFSTNRRKFRLQEDALSKYLSKDLTRQTTPEDFRKSPPPHRAWLFTKNP